MQRVYSTYCVHENVMLHIFWIKVIYLRVNVLYVFNFNFSTVHEHLNTNNPAVVDPSTLFLFDGPHTYFDPNTHMKKSAKTALMDGYFLSLQAPSINVWRRSAEVFAVCSSATFKMKKSDETTVAHQSILVSLVWRFGENRWVKCYYKMVTILGK